MVKESVGRAKEAGGGLLRAGGQEKGRGKRGGREEEKSKGMRRPSVARV